MLQNSYYSGTYIRHVALTHSSCILNGWALQLGFVNSLIKWKNFEDCFNNLR
jgi:hypothetical protein